MGEIIVVIKSRAGALRFYDELRSYNISCRLINTPKEAKTGCGLSVKLLAKDLKRAQIILSRGIVGVEGIFAVEHGGLKKIG